MHALLYNPCQPPKKRSYWNELQVPTHCLRKIITTPLINSIILRLEEFADHEILKYAILSNTWGSHEVSSKDVQRGNTLNEAGLIKFVCQQAAKGYLGYPWANTLHWQEQCWTVGSHWFYISVVLESKTAPLPGPEDFALWVSRAP